jgi:valyl-tRNA synthetase
LVLLEGRSVISTKAALNGSYVVSIFIRYCKKCNKAHVPEPGKYRQPWKEKAPFKKCSCGSDEFVGDERTFDTWMDSSITCAVHAGWPDREDWKKRFPADVHPSGIDIIRTWAYYLMVRHLALFNETPYKSCLINGMVLGSDGRKMSKSLKNYVAAPEVLGKFGADATRQWAAGGGTTGSDIPFPQHYILSEPRAIMIVEDDEKMSKISKWLKAYYHVMSMKVSPLISRTEMDKL